MLPVGHWHTDERLRDRKTYANQSNNNGIGLPAKTGIERQRMIKNYAITYGLGNRTMKLLDWASVLGPAVFALGVGVTLPAAVDAEPQRGAVAVACTNPYSGATWQIRIDYDRRTVDSNPAEIDDATISWRDRATGWHYDLDRKSGKLTIILASSTGGNFLYDNCKL